MNAATTEIPIQILIVDDEENILRSLKRLLTNEEFEVLTAISGEDALKILSVNPDIALIVSDQRMPGLSGVDFLEKAREILPDALRILLTGYADIHAVADAINRGGAYRYITKPWNDEEFVQIIKEAAQRFILVKENKRLQTIVKKQNKELTMWNSQLESLVKEQTIEIKKQNEELETVNRNLKENFKNSILAFSGLIELRDKKTGSHSRNVAALSVKIVRKMELSNSEIETITVAALLHDIGKIGVPDAVLSMDLDKTDAEEWKEYMMHPVRGQTAIDSVENLRKAGILIRHHHERYNGTGFPDKLSGERIPLGSRIIAIADFFEKTIKNLTGNNLIQTALNKVKEELSKRFDPKIYSFTEVSVKEIYLKDLNEIYSTDSSKTSSFGKELSINDLKPGMTLSRDVKSGTGIVLLTRGTILNTKNIVALRRYYQLDPSETGVFVLFKRK